MTEKEKIIFCRLCNSIGLPLDIQMTNVIFDVKELVETKGDSSSMKDLDDIVVKNTIKTKEEQNVTNKGV